MRGGPLFLYAEQLVEQRYAFGAGRLNVVLNAFGELPPSSR